jgi:hypothetical protein
MTYAQVQDGIILNIIELDDISLIPVFVAGWQYLVRIDIISPEPAIGWTTVDGINFSPP